MSNQPDTHVDPNDPARLKRQIFPAEAFFRVLAPMFLFGATRTFIKEVTPGDPNFVDALQTAGSVVLLGIAGFLINQPRSQLLRLVGQSAVFLSALISPETPVNYSSLSFGTAVGVFTAGSVAGLFFPDKEETE